MKGAATHSDAQLARHSLNLAALEVDKHVHSQEERAAIKTYLRQVERFIEQCLECLPG